MRRVLALALLGLGLGGTVTAQTVKAAVGGELTGQRFGSVTVPIAVDMSAAAGAKLGSYTARLTWNPAALGFVTALAGNFPPPQVNSDSSTSGVLKFTSVSPAGGTGVVTVAQLVFSVPDTIGTPLVLSFNEMSAAGTFANLLPTLTIANATFCPSRGRWGDVDRDGASNSRDALLVLSKVVGLPVDTTIDTVSTQPLIVDTTLFDSGLGDVNADGAVTSVDALIILSTAVGIPIPGERVLILAPGGCGTGSPSTLAVFPGTAQLTVGQDYHFLAQGKDTAGRTVTLSNATWRSSDLNVAGVDADGTVHPRAAGTATITAAVGPGVSATASVTVLSRRSKWYVDAAVTGAQVQFGNQAFPFDNPLRAFPIVQEGDTIAVAPGMYDFVDYGILNVGVVIQGGTPGDTTTRPLFRDAGGYHTALEFDGGQHALVQNIAFRNFGYAVDLEGLTSFALEDARIEGSQYLSAGLYSCWGGVMDSVRLDRVVFAGDSLYRNPTAIDFGGCDNSVALKTLTLRDSRMRFFGDGISVRDVDSVAVVRSQLLDNNGYGIALYQANTVVVPALWMSHSRIDRATNTAVYGYPLRRVVVDTSEITASNSSAIALNFCDCSGPGNLEVGLHGDSIIMTGTVTYYDWLNASSSDSVTIDGLVVRYPADTAFTAYGQVNAAVLAVTRSRFLNVGNGNTIYFSGGRFTGDSLTFTGCAVAGCDGATGVTAYPQGSAPAVSLQHSSFTQLATPLYAYGPGGVTFAHNVADSITNGVQIQADSATVTDNTITRATLDGMRFYLFGTPGATLVARDTIACSPGNTGHGINLSGLPAVVEDNLVTGCYNGIYDQQSTLGSVLRRNTIRTPFDGIVVTSNFNVTTRVDSNGVSGAGDAGVYRAGAGRLTMTHNNISGNVTGVFIDGGNPGIDTHVLHDNSFTGNSGYAVSSQFDTVNAQANWWGDPAGPSSGLADSASGIVDTTLFLTAAPLGLPGLAPRLLAAATPVRTTALRAGPPVPAAPSPPPAHRAPPVVARVRPALRIPPRMPVLRAAALQERARRQAAQDAKDAALARGRN